MMLDAEPIISEFMADNQNALLDGDENESDWIEIYHAGDQSVNLQNYRLTDDDADPEKWVFPSVDLSPGDFILVFASGQATDNYVDVSYGSTLVVADTTLVQDLVNVAPRGTATQSTTLGGFAANLAIDGNTGNFTHTLGTDAAASWRLTLPAADYDSDTNWRSSAMAAGSPGSVDPQPLLGNFNGDRAVNRGDVVGLVTYYGDSGNSNRSRHPARCQQRNASNRQRLVAIGRLAPNHPIAASATNVTA